MGTFTVYPAIDLRRGQVVRLKQGDPARQTTYSHNPAGVARRWLQAGAIWLHVVNLDRAFGEVSDENLKALQAVLASGAQVQFGGGLRSLTDVEAAIELGVQRVILGTAAVENPEMVQQAVSHFGTERVAVGIDARQDQVQVRGWVQDAEINSLTLAVRLSDYGVTTVIVTDISRDGMGEGVNLTLATDLAQTGLSVIASGGVASLMDVHRVRQAGLQGVVIGRALYEGQFTLDDALKC
ncbi:MAG: 1-(5-phosphoribosyl)-5-[(5-phosphoribosylamino)methylideneamino]imidazole-4-carboxamide isomerase [Anaerolineales bacterium]|nr:1-(5-phosphoribosyl)-5-[(5-phosphoribosylamino)methylideneamino]imidazole-4-carboxamide isomerase [Anaerolineales bacterium]